jgi:hypothetical protein
VHLIHYDLGSDGFKHRFVKFWEKECVCDEYQYHFIAFGVYPRAAFEKFKQALLGE